MDSNRDALYRQEELCVRRYHKGCRDIEDKQDHIRKEKRLLEEIEEQIHADAEQTYQCYNDYAHSNDRDLYQAMASAQNRIVFARNYTYQAFAEQQDELAKTERRLAREREDLDRKYKEEMRTIRDKEKGRK